MMVGQMVHYRLDGYDVGKINSRRFVDRLASGNDPMIGQLCAAVVVRDWGNGVLNLQVLLDGSDSLWVTSKLAGDGEGCWSVIGS